jgi:DNA-binding IclR family transcriptional regulator
MHNMHSTPSPPTARALAVLETLAECSDSCLSSSQIARQVGLSTSTTAAILATMQDAGYVERLANREYQLGPGLLRLLAGLRPRYPLLGAADEELARLSGVAGSGATLSRITADDLEVVLTVGTVDEFETRAGHCMPLYPPYGSVAVAWQSPAGIDEWLSSAPEPLTRDQLDELRSTLAGISERGYAVYSVEQDVGTKVDQIRHLLSQMDDHAPSEALRRLLLNVVVGVRIYTTAELAQRRRLPISYVIAPVFGPDQQPRYLVSLHIMREAVPAADLDHCIDALLHTASALTTVAGGSWPKLSRSELLP